MRKNIGEIGLILVAIIWGSGFVASAVSLEHFTPYQILVIRFLVGIILLSFVFFKKLKNIKKSTIIKGSIIGVFLYLAFALQTVGLVYTTPSKNAFITAVNVVIVPLIAFFIFKRKMDKFEFFGALLAIIGIGVLSLKLSGGVNFGDFLTLLCAVAFAFHIIYTAMFVKNEDPVLLTVVQMAVATVLGFIVVLFKGETHFEASFEGVTAVLYLGIISTTIAFLLQTVAQKYTNETKAAIILSTEAFWGMVFSIIILSEVLTGKMVIGATLILVAIIISETKLVFFKRDYRGKVQ
ncbi:Permease of the drug/metabolite transporter (DMT) superfamily [Psychrobacillus sp. OK028]|uniref:DMT family transporter n=1 Tax=Psychrobacillus sp. OK028 TaxID=1884359 RepID=UPI00087EA4AF|nr:DMT family transporter [Psychrobacillus sp. OK028]SDN13341.1 Permease of the drug/metabolite transporter (DMT) superfamily [Psychrobacillus sp. OK028]